jgi:hypothetical protein
MSIKHNISNLGVPSRLHNELRGVIISSGSREDAEAACERILRSHRRQPYYCIARVNVGTMIELYGLSGRVQLPGD